VKVIVVGGGKLGTTLAADAVSEGHDVVLVDCRQEVLDQVAGRLDLRILLGNGAGYEVLIEAGAAEADLFIATTSSDELNMIASIIAGKLGAKVTMARVRNPELSSEVAFVRDSLGISFLINPDLEAAREIARIIRFPHALSIDMLAQGRVQIVELALPSGSAFSGRPLFEFRAAGGAGIVCAVKRGHVLNVP
jgi:trk system potassium uptake protein TrkA